MTVANEPFTVGSHPILRCQRGNARERHAISGLSALRRQRGRFLLPEEDAIHEGEEDDDDIDPFTPGDLWFRAIRP